MKRKVCEKMEMKMKTKEKGELTMEMQDAGCKMQVKPASGIRHPGSALFPNPYSLFPYLVVVLFLIASAGIATAAGDGVCVGATTNFTCGDVVTEGCTFNESMSCPTGHGLEIGEDGIVIDGNGYCIDGVSPGDTDRAGIYNYKYDNVVIKNLEVKNFCFGIRLKGYYSDPTDFDYVVNNTIDNCKVHDNGNPDGGVSQGIDLYAASHCNVTNNEVYNNTGMVTGGCGDGGMGIRMHGENHPSLYAGYHTVTNNTVYGNRLSGIYSKMKSMYNYVAYNDVYENGELGQNFGGGIRLMCLMTNNWIIEYNNVTDNTGPGILVGGKNNIVRHNTVTGSKTAATHSWEKGHGINICRGSTNNTLTSNIVCENEDTDIAVIQSSFATGDENTCDTSYNYDDAGTTGCMYSCGPAEIGCVAAHDGTVYKCGDMVVQSCTFNGDMSCPSGHGLEIGEDGIVIDGNEYCIDGVSPGDCVATRRAGIYNYNYDNVVIENVEVKNFCYGIRLTGSSINPVEYNTIDNCTVHDNGNPEGGLTHGIVVRRADYCNVTNNEVYNNTGFVCGGCEDGGMGILLYGYGAGTEYGHHNVINNTVYRNRLSGIYSKMSCRYNYIAYNDVYENGHLYSGDYFGGGIRLECMQTNDWIIEYNNVTDNLGPGIFVRGDNNVIRYNNESGSKNAGDIASGCAVSVGYGLFFCTQDSASDNTVTSNIFCENEGLDIAAGEPGDYGNTGDENTCDTTYNYDDAGTIGCSYFCGGTTIIADFSAEPTKGVSPLEVRFNDESKAVGGIANCTWNFGDGNITPYEPCPEEVNHTYSTAGEYSYYNVSLTVNESGAGGGTDTETKAEYIKVWKQDAAPDADFSASPRKMGTTPMIVDFTDLSLGEVESWFWDFGDGGTSEEQNPTHEYTTGVYTVSLAVTGPGGSVKDAKTNYIVVNRPEEPLPAQTDAHFFASTRSGAPPLEVTFTDMSRSEGEIDSWLWDFGDGNTSSEVNPTHTYSTEGTYNVSFEVIAGDAKANETKTGYITVSYEQPGICGDVNEDGDVNMLDVIDLLYYVSYPGEYAIGSAWAADVNCDESINMGDVARLLYNVSYPGEYELGCCES